MSKNIVVYIEPSNVNAATGAAVLDVCERTFHELVKRGDITKIQIPGMRRTTYSLKEIRALAERWRAGGHQNRDAVGDAPTPPAAV